MSANRNRDPAENRNVRPLKEKYGREDRKTQPAMSGREDRKTQPAMSGREDREAERERKQKEQLKAARKRDIYMIGGFIGILLVAVLLISIATRDTRKGILDGGTSAAADAADGEEDENASEPETVIDVIGKNPEPSEDTASDDADKGKASDEQPSDSLTPAAGPEPENTETAPPETAETAAPEPETAAPEAAAPETAAPQTSADPSIPAASSANVSGAVIIPSWVIQDFLNISPRNRPGIAMPAVHDIVVHWVANPGTTAKGNRDYFNDLAIPEANLEDRSASSHFVVGLDGEIIQCIPLEEIAYANYPRNDDTISIEVCHPDWSGQYNNITYASLIRLIAYLCQQYGLNADHVIRHHDVSGKDCPKYYVEHPEAWEQLKYDVTVYMSQHPDILREFP